MKQSRTTSLLKSCVSTAVGFGIAFAANAIILPYFGLPISHSANLLLTTIYTVISIVRGYALERIFEAMGWRTRMSAFAMAVLAERQRQITHEGWTPEHDADLHSPRSLALAAAAYLIGPERFTVTDYEADENAVPCSGRLVWPWELDALKFQNFRRDAVRGCALGLAAGELADRHRQRKSSRRNIAVASEPEPRGA